MADDKPKGNGAGGAVAEIPKSPAAILTSDKLAAALRDALPKHLTADRFIRIAKTAMTRTPLLAKCSPLSFYDCLIEMSTYGFTPDGRHAHLIPFRNKGKLEATLIIDYKGIVKCVRQSGEVSSIHADVVYTNDVFSFAYGTDEHLKHEPTMSADRGERHCVYSFVRMRDGSTDFRVFRIADVDAVRARSKAAHSGPWVSDYDEMAKKTAFRNHSKWLPFSVETTRVIEADDHRQFDPTDGVGDGLGLDDLEHGGTVDLRRAKPADATVTDPADGDDGGGDDPGAGGELSIDEKRTLIGSLAASSFERVAAELKIDAKAPGDLSDSDVPAVYAAMIRPGDDD